MLPRKDGGGEREGGYSGRAVQREGGTAGGRTAQYEVQCAVNNTKSIRAVRVGVCTAASRWKRLHSAPSAAQRLRDTQTQ